jgi:hypothetical protein
LYDAFEVRDIRYVFNVKVQFAWLDGIDDVAELGLHVRVLAEFVGDPGGLPRLYRWEVVSVCAV